MGIQFNNGNQASSTANQLFDRRAVVNVGSNEWGTLIAGRDYVPTYTIWVAHDPFSHVGVAGTNNLASATPTGPIRAAFGTAPNTTVRANDAVQWVLPKNGLNLEGGVFAGLRANGAVADGKNDVQGFRLAGNVGPVKLSVAQSNTRNSLTTAGDFKDTVVAANTTVSGVRLIAAQRRFTYDKATQTNTLLAAIAPAPGGQVKLSYLDADFGGSVGTTNIAPNGVRQIGLGYVLELSPRTVVYTNASRITNQGATSVAIPGGAAGLVAGGRSQGLEVGVRHNF
jgi:predicted porin